jgi:hypothetical protein
VIVLVGTRLREGRFPSRAELDAAAPRNPVVVDGAYALVVNTAALAAAGIDGSTPAPAGGAIVKDARGERCTSPSPGRPKAAA